MSTIGRLSMRVLGMPKMPAYLHIPKTGGTYIGQSESDGKRVLYPVKTLGHKYIVDKEAPQENIIYLQHDPERASKQVITWNKARRYYLFATVRNIFDWLVSYAGHAGEWNSRYCGKGGYDYHAANRGFDYLVRAIADREEQWPSRKMIHCQLFSSGGRLVTDWLNRTHTLDDDLAALAKYKGLIFRRRAPQRVGNRKDYRSYYTDSLVDLVYQTWGQELSLFGFGFESSSLEKAVLKQRISGNQKNTIKYDWASNRLVTGNHEICE